MGMEIDRIARKGHEALMRGDFEALEQLRRPISPDIGGSALALPKPR